MTPNFQVPDLEYKVFQFPSGEIQVQIINYKVLPSYTITGSIRSSDHLMELLQLVDAIRNAGRDFPIDLVMPYCAYSRQDRICNPGESFSLKVFAKLINSCNFNSITTWDNHSDVSTALLDNCISRPVNDLLTRADYMDNMQIDLGAYDYFISPDAGANKKVQACSNAFNVPMVRADKVRDTKTGAIVETKVFTQPNELVGATVLIIDDICQGGRTFEELAKAIHNIGADTQVDLYVTHGFFNKGFTKLAEAGITNFYCTNSVPQVHTTNNLHILEL